MTVGDVGVIIAIAIGGEGYTAPAGSTAQVLAAPGAPFIGASEVVIPGTTTITPDGMTVLYATAGNGLDFQSDGNWIVKARIVPPSGQQRTSPPGQFYVFPG